MEDPRETESFDEEDEYYDTVCAICENGGELVCCAGKCFRSFHRNPYSEVARDSRCFESHISVRIACIIYTSVLSVLSSVRLINLQIQRDIMFDVRAWDGVLVKSRALIYCEEHEIDPEIGTPARAIIFRNILVRCTEQPYKKKRAVYVDF